ncbi:MAG: FHA domain-containing protein [Planctomycetota bacterium]|nr:MAG: FHA domain-containing protein [Planctomycetota bacterium]
MTGELFFVIRFSGMLERVQQAEAAEMTIGRQATNVVCLPNSAVSRNHAVLSRKRAEFLIRDLGSRNGTLLNGQRIVEAVLSVPALIEIGPYQLKVCRDLNSAQEEAEGVIESTCNQPGPNRPRSDREQWEQQLTPAQHRVYKEFLCGRTEKEVANALKISIHTVHTHSRAIYTKFEVSSRGELLSQFANHLTQHH